MKKQQTMTGGLQSKALFIALRTGLHDAMELSQRLNLNPVIIGTGSGLSWYKKDSFRNPIDYWRELERTDDEVLAEIRLRLDEEYPLIVLGSHPRWECYPLDIRAKILVKVAAGARMLVSWPTPVFEKELKDKGGCNQSWLDSAFPLLDEEKFQCEVYALGKGRVATITPQVDEKYGFLIASSPNQAVYEYRVHRLVRLVQQLLSKRQAVLDAIEISPAAAKRMVALVLPPNKDCLQVTAELRDLNYRLLHNCKIEIKPHSEPLRREMPLPALPNGICFLLATVAVAGEPVDWAGDCFNVDNDVGFADIMLQQDVLLAGSKLALNLNYRGQLDSPRLRLAIRDNWGRLCHEEEYYKLPKKLEIPAPENSLTVLNFVDLELASAERLVERRTVEFTLPSNGERKNFYLFLWNGNEKFTWWHKQYYDAVRRQGVDAFCNTPVTREAARAAAGANMLTIPYSTSFNKVTLPQLFDEEWMNKMAERAERAAVNHGAYGTFAYTLGDEIYVSPFVPEGRFWNSEVLWKEFRAYLQGEYGLIEEVNRQWETSYKDWSEIHFASESELLRDVKNPSAWVDFRMFVSTKFIDVLVRMRDVIRKHNPSAYVGYDGCEQFSSYDGYDWYPLCQKFDLNNVYARYFVDYDYPSKQFNGQCIRTFAERKNLRGCWLNGLALQKDMSCAIWNLLFAGFSSAWWWHGTFLGDEVDAFNWRFEPTAVFAKVLRETAEIKRGPATLLAHAQPAGEPAIAVHYSANNWHASNLAAGIGNHINALGLKYDCWFAPNLPARSSQEPEVLKLWKGIEPRGHYASASRSFITMLNDLSLPYSMMARQQIESGALKNFKALILPFVESLSPKEVDTIKEYVKSGGVLIADYHCGMKDAHGRLRKEGGALDEVFGIRQEGLAERKPIGVRVDGRFTATESLRNYFTASFGATFSASKVKVEKGKALGCTTEGAAAFILNEFGKGIALFCNFDVYAYFDLRRSNQEVEMRGLFHEMLRRAARIRLPSRPTYCDGQLLSQTQTFYLCDGVIRYVGVLRGIATKDSSPWDIVIPFHWDGHIYDIRARQYLGRRCEIQARLEEGEAKLYASLPYKVKSVETKHLKSSKRGTSHEIKIKVIPEGAGQMANHAVLVRVCEPNGVERFYLERVLYLPNGEGKFLLPVALNDPCGNWTVTLEEVISGKKGESVFLVE
ncbi:MAG: beta-galactosidase trimerization domain-containing protein [Verrucomicrobiae bacterium]|nr:beta-galactosidase trimerization domain-containing protein [Verrucomicrobiae bacterium]